MWNSVVGWIVQCLSSAFGWLGAILDAAPGAWDTILTMFVILALSRFLLSPLLGAFFAGGIGASDRAKKARGNKNG